MTLEQDMSVILVSPESSEHLQEKRGSVASGSEVDTADKRDGTVVHDVVVIAQLRARVEQQSSLIGMMKQRNDDTFMQLNQYRTSYEKEVAQNREFQNSLEEMKKAKSTLEQRFHTLSSNHEELIKFKDEYKTENQRLREEIAELRNKHDEVVLEDLQERARELLVLREAVRAGQEREKAMMSRCTSLEEKEKELEKHMRKKEMVYRKDLEKEQAKWKAAQQKLSAAEAKAKSAETDALQLCEKNTELVISSNCKDDELKAKTAENDRLQVELKRMQKEKESLSEEIERLSEEVSGDIQVKKLRKQLREEQSKVEKLQKEFMAYQKHSSDLLQKERELNSKLRHLSDL